MAVAPKFAAHTLGAEAPKHTLELYLDYACPFSAKLFSRVYNDVAPLLKSQYASKVNVVFRHQVQPWHPSSTLRKPPLSQWLLMVIGGLLMKRIVHEAALAVERVSPQSFWEFSAELFKRQVEFFDVNVVNETRNQTYKRLAHIASIVNADSESQVLSLLTVPGDPVNGAFNVGNGVTDSLKLHIKAARLVSIHVSPTVVFNGIVENSISSGWTYSQWEEWLSKNVV